MGSSWITPDKRALALVSAMLKTAPSIFAIDSLLVRKHQGPGRTEAS